MGIINTKEVLKIERCFLLLSLIGRSLQECISLRPGHTSRTIPVPLYLSVFFVNKNKEYVIIPRFKPF